MAGARLRDRSWKEIGPALGSESQFRNAHKTKRATLVLASVALLAAVAHVTNKKSTNKNLFSDRGHPGCLPPQVAAKSGVRFAPWFWSSLSVTAFEKRRYYGRSRVHFER